MSFKQFTKELNGSRVEGEILKTVFYSLVTSFIVIGILYLLILKNVTNFIPKYGFYLFLAAISYALILPAVRQVRAYKQFGCMSGMMIGMTVGMVVGFMSGLMGAMTSVMLLNDHLKLATVIISIFTAIISLSLNYMIFFEMKENERQKEEDHFMTIIITFVLIVLITWLMVYGPRSALFI